MSQLDSDNDGVNDAVDQCPATPAGETVDANGCAPSQLDTDNDGVNDAVDQCPVTPIGETVDANGCALSQLDSDNDDVSDAIDQCPGTSAGETVDDNGCALSQLDSDNDGVNDALDQCPATPAGATVDANGCAPSQLDTDNDGVNDAADQCPATPIGETVDANGCALSQLDSDNDGVSDAIDQCPGTPAGAAVDIYGCAQTQLDTDNDGVNNAVDQCPATPVGESVDSNGCALSQLDTDNDGVSDAIDQCPSTPAGSTVDATGCVITQLDSDNDGVNDAIDQCPGTSAGETVDANGCALSQLDSDNDGINDALDQCPATPAGATVDANGCALSQLDSDNDGVNDAVDLCPATPAGETVNANGCALSQLDSDNDGVNDAVDQCPATPAGATVDANGCALSQLDSDNDGVNDAVDQCPATPAGVTVDANGCALSQLDSDNDGVNDAIDQCPATPAGETPDANGCSASQLPTSLPPDPTTVAPPIDPTESTTLAAATEFLYTGTDPIQTGVSVGTIEPKRGAVLRGRVTARDNTVLPGVTITIQNHPEFGQTLTRADGMFDMAVNGGGLLTVQYSKDGYLPIQRQIDVPWQDYAIVTDIVMIPLDAQVTTVDLTDTTQAFQVAQGNSVVDADGSRQATILFPQGTNTTMTLPDGTTQSLSTINVRATEYTVGDNGPQAMPGELPPTSGYTYAIELSVDEAIAAGATRVDFDQPVPFYVDNFLNFPVGEPVPAGWYDRERAAWIPADNGRVIGILAINAGVAELDIDGSGVAAGVAQLAALGITAAEQTRLASLYPVGKSLWRTPVSHFTPWDCNWPYGPPMDATTSPAPSDNSAPSDNDQECINGCIIQPQSQSLGEKIPVIGTPYQLHYQSKQAAGYQAARTLTIPLAGDSIPASLLSIDLTIEVAGQVIKSSLAPSLNLTEVFTWDGKDAYGRPVNITTATVTVDYNYQLVYYSASTDMIRSFSQATNSGGAVIGTRGNQVTKLRRQWQTTLDGIADAPNLASSALVRQAKLGASCRVQVPVGRGISNDFL